MPSRKAGVIVKLRHGHLMALKDKLGYRHLNGVCTGFAGMLMQAILADDEDSFYKRLAFIESRCHEIDRFIHDIQHVQNTRRIPPKTFINWIYQLLTALFKKIRALFQKPKQPLSQTMDTHPKAMTDEDKQLLDILSFVNGMALYLQPGDYADVFNQSYISQSSIQAIYEFAKPTCLENTSLTVLLEKSHGFDAPQLKSYFEDLAHLLDEEAQTTAILLRSVTHTVSLKWCIKKHHWEFVNVNNLGQVNDIRLTFKAHESDQLTQQVFKSLIGDYGRTFEYCVFQTQILSAHQHVKLADRLTAFDTHHPITQAHAEITQANADGTVLFLACKLGQLRTVQELLRHDVDIEARYDGIEEFYHGETALSIACTKGDINVVNALLSAGAQVNTVSRGMSPLYQACRNGHLEVVQALLKKGAKTDFIGPKGDSLFSIAAAKGHQEILNALQSNPRSKSKMGFFSHDTSHQNAPITSLRSGLPNTSPSA